MLDLNEIKEKFKVISDLIISSDETGKVFLLPCSELYKYFELIIDRKELEELEEKIGNFKVLIRNNLVSEKYVKDQWENQQLFEDFINNKSESISQAIEYIWEKEVRDFVIKSNKSISEKIEYLVEVRSNFLHIQLHDEDLDLQKKIEYLNINIQELEMKFKYSNNQNVDENNSEKYIDFSDNKIAERIVFLHELGILDFLKKKMHNELHYFSANSLAEIISTFTNIKQGTAQSYLNPIYSKEGIKSKNYPLTTKNMKNVNEKLLRIGFNNEYQPL